MEIKNKTIIVIGTARIGQKVLEFLKDKGANLIITYLNSPKEAGDFGFSIQADISKKEDIERVIKFAKTKFGKIDGLVHMAAIYEKTAWDKLDENSWDRNINIIAKSSFLLGKIAGDEMLKNQGDIKGKMIFFSDWSVLARPYKDYLPYNAAKAAVVGISR